LKTKRSRSVSVANLWRRIERCKNEYEWRAEREGGGEEVVVCFKILNNIRLKTQEYCGKHDSIFRAAFEPNSREGVTAVLIEV
jgi:outer membrane phospholipase A